MKNAARPFAARVHSPTITVALISMCVACSQTPVVLPSRDLDRPTDMTFACIGRFTTDGKVTAISGQPMGKCHPSLVPEPTKPVPVQGNGEEYRTYSFVVNSDRGDLSVIDMSYCRPDDTACHPPGATLVDLDPTTVGFRAAPLGVLPEVVAASQDGCRVVTANRGSCDLTLVDPTALLARHLDPRGDLPNQPDIKESVTVVPLMASGRLAVAPGEIAFVPQQTALLGDQTPVCDATIPGTLAPPVGDPAPAAGERVPWRAVVTFPSCDLVALIELPSGMILDSYQVRYPTQGDTSVPILVQTGTNPVCPSTDCPYAPAGLQPDGSTDSLELGRDAGDDSSTAKDADTTPAPTPKLAPASGRLGIMALAIRPEGQRIYFGGSNTPSIFSLDIDGMRFAIPGYAPPNAIPSLAGAGGVLRMRLSVDPYAYSKGHDVSEPTLPEYGRFVAGSHDYQPSDPLEFLYVIASDGSLRVVDVGRPDGAADRQPVECDLWIDPGDPNAQASDGTRRACFQYPPPNPVPKDWPRRLLSAGIPGLRFSGPPQDVAFANYFTPATTTPATPTVDEQLMSGAFAFVMTNAGAVYVLNIDPEPRKTHQAWTEGTNVHNSPTDPATNLPESPPPLTHSERDFNVLTYSTSLGAQIGPPRIDTAPSAPVEGPSLKGFQTLESRIDARAISFTDVNKTNNPATYAYFPNLATVHPQTWRIEWEGDISGVRATGDIDWPASTPPVITIRDNGSGFCPLGGGDGDVMTLVGCDTDAGCPVGMACIHSSEVPAAVDGRTIQGMCLPRSPTTDQVTNETLQACEPMMQTFRRYEIMTATDGTTTVVPRRAEVPRPAYTNEKGQRVSCDPNKLDVTTGESADCNSNLSQVFAKFSCVELSVRPDGNPLRPDRVVVPDTGTVLEPDLHFRCLQVCQSDAECRGGRVCVSYPGDDRKFCAEAAPIVQGCGLDQLVSYKLSAGGAFVVTGSLSGRTEAPRLVTTPSGPTCKSDQTIPGFVARIPLNTSRCGDDATPVLSPDGTFLWDDAYLGKVAPQKYPASGPCFICEKNSASGMPPFSAVTGTTCSPSTSVVSAVFQNTELRFVMTNLQKQFTDPLLIQFNVSGGFSAQTVVTSSDALPGLPATILLGPISSADQSLAVCPEESKDLCVNPSRLSDLPYLFVVDQRAYSNGRLGPRGQILRITPRISSTAPYAGFEGFTSSGRYFPIQ
jgi:hypothetical protein